MIPMNSNPIPVAHPQSPNQNQKLIVPSVAATYFFSPEEITRLESNSNYTRIFFTNRKPLLMAKVLKKYEEVLVPMGFIRIHQSHIVNKRYISSIEACGEVVMEDNQTITISRRKRKAVMAALQADARILPAA